MTQVNTDTKGVNMEQHTTQYEDLTQGLGQKVMLLRLEKGLGVREAARAAKIDPATWRAVEHGRVPHAATLKRIAGLYGCSPLELLSIPQDAA